MIVLDTHAWIWKSVAPDRLSEPARGAIELATQTLISPISCLEITSLVRRGRLALDRDVQAWIGQALAQDDVRAIDVSPEVAMLAGDLPDPFPGDPADRLIYATAVSQGVRLVTKDRAIREFDPARTVW